MKHRHAIFKKQARIGLMLLLAGGAIIPQSSVLKAETSVTQQSRKITGTSPTLKEAPISVNVVVKGTTNGTITDLDGKYVLEVEPNAILVISYIGYVTQQTPASGNVMNITLKEDTQNLDEVVVVRLRYPTEKGHHRFRSGYRYRRAIGVFRFFRHTTVAR